MTLKRSFAQYMEEVLLLGTFGDDIFLNGAPLDISPCWWIIATGGAPVFTNHTGEKLKNYVVSIYYRDTDAQAVDEALQELEVAINTNDCDQLEGFVTVDISVTTFPADQDLDVEDRTVGLAQVTVQTYL